MAHSLSAQKRIRQNVKARSRNRWRKRTMRSAIKHFEERLQHGSVEEAREAFHAAARLLDKTAQQGSIHKNLAARKKSRLNARLKAKSAG